jgi:hypothetical protein
MFVISKHANVRLWSNGKYGNFKLSDYICREFGSCQFLKKRLQSKLKKNMEKIYPKKLIPYSSAAERLKHRRLSPRLARVRIEDGYRLISGRSQDRNLLGE